MLLNRNTGAILADFDITRRTSKSSLAALPSKSAVTIPDSGVPFYLQCRLQRILGDSIPMEILLASLAGGTGGSGQYTDNSIANVGDLLFVVGGGPAGDAGTAVNGALVAVKITPGTPPTLDLHWYMESNGATGSSPTVDPSGRWVVITDTVSVDGGEPRARLVVADIAACNANAGNVPPSCPPAWTYVLNGKALNAHVSIDEDGVVYAWQQNAPEVPDEPELLAVERNGSSNLGRVKWSSNFPASEAGFSCPRPEQLSTEWSSTALVLDNIVVGTITHLCVPTVEQELKMPLPIAVKTQHELVGVRRSDGAVLWRNVPSPDDSINSPLMGADGHLYVPILGMIDFAKLPSGGPYTDCATFNAQDTDFTGGVQQYRVP